MNYPLTFVRLFAITLFLSACGGSGSSDSAPVQSGPAMAHLTVNKTGSGAIVSLPGAIDCGTQCDDSFAMGTAVQLSASPANGYKFVGWSGSGVSCASSDTCSVMMSKSQTVTATFSAMTATQYNLDVTIAGSGTVVSNVSGVNCPTDCTGSYASGTVVTLTASAASGYTFTGWSGSGVSCPGTGTCVLTMSSARAATATFTQNALPTFALTTTVVGSGSISSNPSGISCGSSCTAAYASGTVVTLSAAPASGFSFTGWSNGGCSGTNSCAVTMSAARQAQATFTAIPPNTAALNAVVNGSGTVTSSPAGINCPTDCAETLTIGTVVTLTATPTTGNRLTGWSISSCAANATCAVTVSSATTVTATFAPITFTLAVTKQGSGTVSSSPSGISCGATCSASYNSGASVTLTAAPATGYTFTNWTGACTGSSTCTVAMSTAKSVGAVFTALPTYGLTVQTSGAGSGTITSSPSGISCGATCTATFNSGTSVQLTPSPAAGSSFSSWGGACSGSGSCTVSMSSAQTVTATFAVSTSSGKTYYVSPTGSDSANGTSLTTPFKTLAKSVSVVNAGDIIEVRAGTYTETVTIGRPGSSSAWITIRGYAGDARPVIKS
ncbi:MAG: InlB B-repeat-containing protein, partial [Rhizobacter sp.]